MIRVVMLYPRTGDSRFEMNYYLTRHIPRIREIFMEQGLLDLEVQQGIAGAMPGQPSPYMCISSFLFEKLEGFQKGFAAQGAWIMGDVPNYTNVQPQVQISNVVHAPSSGG